MKKERIKPQETHVMHNTTAHHSLTDAQPIPKQWSAALGQLPPVYLLSMMFCDVEYPSGQLGSALPALLPPGFLCTCLLAEHGKLKKPSFRVRTS